MIRILKNIASQGLLILLVIQTINLSVNSVDFYNSLNTKATYVDQDYVDSMLEYLVENVFGFSKNTIHDKANIDNTSKQQQASFHIDLKWFPNDVIISDLNETSKLVVNIIPRNELLINLYFKEVPVKPPQFHLA